MDRNVDEKGQYQLGCRSEHTSAVVGEVLYCWGGDQDRLDMSHCNFSTKKQYASTIDAFNFLSGVWSSQPTRGTPPLGIMGVSCTTINNNIYYFGGWCGHDTCYHNSLNCLDTLTLQWKELQPTDNNSVTKRNFGGMIAMGGEGEPQQLLVVGGIAPRSTTTQYHPQFKYDTIMIPGVDDRLRTNEQNIYNLSSRKWIVPSVSGQCFPPTNNFIIERINYNKGIMYGGVVADGIATNSIYLFELSHNIINWEYLKPESIPNDGLWPEGRHSHASTIINGISTSPTLVVIGGLDRGYELVNECWLLDTNQYNWRKITLPDSVTGRFDHTVSSFVLDPNHVFLIIVGGDVRSEEEKGGVIKWFDATVTDPNVTIVVELVFNDDQWSVGPVLDSFNIPLLYEQILKERTKELIEYMTDKEKELQVINESLRHDLQVARINNQSLQKALLESEKKISEMQLLETKTLGEYEKLKAIVADKEVYITELLEEKTQVEEQLKEKQIIIDEVENLKIDISKKDAYISKLLKEKSQQQEKISFQVDNLECLSDVQVPLLKPLQLEIQHCIDLTGRPDLGGYLKFAIAPLSTASLPYQFTLVEGGEFRTDSWYGSIKREKFCLVSVCVCDGGGGGGGGSSSSSEVSSADPLSEPGASIRTKNLSSSGGNDTLLQQHQLEELASTENRSKEFLKAETYAGLVHYEEKGVEDVVTFTAAKNLNALLEFIKKEHSHAERGPHKYFCIVSPDGYIELKFDAPQEKPFTGWTIEPHMKPVKFHQNEIDNFGDKNYSLPPSCPISIYSSPDAVPTLHYSVPLEGVADPVTLYIHRSRRTAHSIASAAPSGSSSHETMPVPTKRRKRGFDIKTAKQKIKQVMNENHSDFAYILESSLKEIANKLFEANIIAQQVQRSPTYDAIASSFLSMMNLLDSKSDLEKHCVKYLEALSSVGGPIEFAANLLREKWTAALEGALQFEQSVKRVRTNNE
ncbi:PREDICTED: uncharacterized protein LOC109585968 [Amphimedon queenslandica]|uniref:Uncharacterized protein n=1 Tax=Amphimedon queenslandica TaxID=400682 RepID=A0AAN0JKW8_AMPQE|nr:PREDICTED: uncharacterized protein LOC109585968 [Amphimedon queenslandica]|eukprot:XP_019857672.1 PREDICTED: uncharacterized protein LOC109585968 [Amphimedon queenslandica]